MKEEYEAISLLTNNNNNNNHEEYYGDLWRSKEGKLLSWMVK